MNIAALTIREMTPNRSKAIQTTEIIKAQKTTKAIETIKAKKITKAIEIIRTIEILRTLEIIITTEIIRSIRIIIAIRRATPITDMTALISQKENKVSSLSANLTMIKVNENSAIFHKRLNRSLSQK